MAKRKNPRFAFFGTPRFAVYVLEELHAAGFVPALIITAPDRPRGRGLHVSPPPVKVWADEHGVDVFQPENVRDAAFLDELGNSEWDVFIVAAYGKLLPQELLALPQKGTLNVHPSLLPRFRGASPIHGQLLADEKKTGVSVMLLDEEMDHGPLLAQASIEPEPWPLPYATLEELLAREGGRLLAETLPLWLSGGVTAEAQDHSQTTYTTKVVKEDGYLDLAADGYQNYLKFCAYSAAPGVSFAARHGGKDIRVKITDARYAEGRFTPLRVIPENGKEMSYEDFTK